MLILSILACNEDYDFHYKNAEYQQIDTAEPDQKSFEDSDTDNFQSSFSDTGGIHHNPYSILRIELTWDQSGDDLDLHLLNEDGVLNNLQNDCFFLNCQAPKNLDWGVKDLEEDDPHLENDDIYGTGPENITIEKPAEMHEYSVYVCDYSKSIRINPTLATVKVFIDESSVLEKSYSFVGEGECILFTTMNWSY